MHCVPSILPASIDAELPVKLSKAYTGTHQYMSTTIVCTYVYVEVCLREREKEKRRERERESERHVDQ